MSRLFPELEGGRAPQAAPTSSDRWPAGAVLAGGSWAASKFDELLGLAAAEADAGCRVRASRVLPDGRLELDLEGGGVPPSTIWFQKKGAGPCYAAAEGFEVACRGQVMGRLRDLVGQAVHRLQKASLEQLKKAVWADPGRRFETAAAAPAPSRTESNTPDTDPKDMLKSLVQVYGSSESWYNFFADKEQQRNFCFNFAGSVVTVGHEDLECHYATPIVGDGSVSFFNYPRVHDRHQPSEQKPSAPPASAPVAAGAAPAPRKPSDDDCLISDLQDLDIIKGGTTKLDALLESVAARETPPDMVIVRSTCVPIVIGDDMEGSIERFKKKSDVPIVFLDNIADQFATPFRETFKKLKEDPEFRHPVKRPGSINLVGFPKVDEIGALLSMLEEAGVEINCRVIPEVDLKAMRRYRAADVAVLFDTQLYDRTYQDVIGGIDLPSIRPRAPYGVAGAKRWLREVAAAVGREAALDAVWERRWAPWSEEWEALRREAAGSRVGFVVDSERIKMLTDPRRSTGVPMAPMLKEMGFGVDFLLYVGDKPNAKEHRKLDSRSPDATLTTFETPDELEAYLRESPAQAFYSEVFFDKRLTRCGKAQFSVRDFEMGPGGAVATLRRVLDACRLPFYRKYQSYLGRPFPE